jgi:hypothetical protein
LYRKQAAKEWLRTGGLPVPSPNGYPKAPVRAEPRLERYYLELPESLRHEFDAVFKERTAPYDLRQLSDRAEELGETLLGFAKLLKETAYYMT